MDQLHGLLVVLEAASSTVLPLPLVHHELPALDGGKLKRPQLGHSWPVHSWGLHTENASLLMHHKCIEFVAFYLLHWAEAVPLW